MGTRANDKRMQCVVACVAECCSEGDDVSVSCRKRGLGGRAERGGLLAGG